MSTLLLALIFLAALAVTVSHARTLRRAQAMPSAPIEVRHRLWQKHERWNGGLWILLFIFVLVANFFFTYNRIAPHPFIGVPLLGIGVVLVIWSRLILGRSGAMGIRWFLPERPLLWEKRSLYRILANPMYDGFIMIFLGLGVCFGAIENFYLAFASFILLNIYLARVESYGRSYHVI